MQVYQKIQYSELSENLLYLLKEEKEKRNFIIEKYINEKTDILNQYMRDCGLDSCVIAVSGGLDSSVTLGLVVEASKQKNSPIKKILALSIPCTNDGATNQDKSTQKAIALCDFFNIELKVVEIGEQVSNFVKSLENQTTLYSDQWSRGQAVSYFRTASIYSITSLMTSNNFRSIVVGTTNRDEGAYIGYFGKASDGMVDVQLISDAHKSDLRKLAEYLSIPKNIIYDSPTGDMYDGRLDEEVFGVPYDFVELYTYYLEKENKQDFIDKLVDLNVFDEFKKMSINLENMHKYNGHKYLGASPAVHLDVIKSTFEGGWIYNTYNGKAKECENPTVGDHQTW